MFSNTRLLSSNNSLFFIINCVGNTADFKGDI